MVTNNKRRKRKGRPQIIDVKKRNNRKPNPNPYQRPRISGQSRRSTRRNPDAELTALAGVEEEEAVDDEEDDEAREDQSSGRRRREKKLHLVLRSNANSRPFSDGDDSGELRSDLEPRTVRRIGGGGDEGKTERHESDLKAIDAPQEPSVPGPTTSLPDKKLLVFILDRLQKKDTYGVFSEPVDPEELPDYHEIVKHPMDFKTIREKLFDGAYANLEQFEKDVYLICSNAMQYNAPDTIYFRQARAIQEKAKKDFENLRQESDDNENEPRPARRGRPPMKNFLKKLGRPERVGSDFSSNANLDGVGDNGLSNFSPDLPLKTIDRSTLLIVNTDLHNIKAPNFTAECRQERHEEYSGFATKDVPLRYVKRVIVPDEDRQSMYKQAQLLSSTHEQPILLAKFDGERKQLVPVGVHVELAYARSVARFAANLGPAGWEFAARLIERVVPPGTKFGRGWVGENDVPQPYQLPTLSKFPSHSSKSENILVNPGVTTTEQSSINLTAEEVRACSSFSAVTSSMATHNQSADSVDGTEFARNCESKSKPQTECGSSGHGMRWKTPFQLHQSQIMQLSLNGFTDQMGFNQSSQAGKAVMPSMVTENARTEAMMAHSRTLDMASKNNDNFMHQSAMSHFNMDRLNPQTDPRLLSNSDSRVHDSKHDCQGSRRNLSLNPKPGSIAPDLNVGFQSPGSPVSGMLIDSQHPDLALQL